MKKLKKAISIFLVVSLALSFIACSNKEEAETEVKKEKYTKTFYDAFDTNISIIAYCNSDAEFNSLFELAKERFTFYHQLFDIYNLYEGINNLRYVNKNAGKETVSVDPAIIELLLLGKKLYEKTDGRVNIAMGSVLSLWHDARGYAENFPDEAKLPDTEALKNASLHCNIDDLIIDTENNTVSFNDSLLSLDVGSIAKGYATECVAKEIERLGLYNVVINAGGNVRSTGPKPEGSWVIGIQHPNKNADSAYIRKVKIDRISVVTSGVYERNFEVDGKSYHHIIDPDTLFPENRFKSVTILNLDSGLADAYSTAIFNMDLEEGKAFAQKENLAVMWVLNDYSMVTNEAFEQYLDD